jgi:UDP-glucose 4-epimerase
MVCRHAGCGSRHCDYPPDRAPIEIGDYWTDNGAFTSATGWTPTVPVAEAVNRTLDFYRDNIDRYRCSK